jgi:DNA modification methylase
MLINGECLIELKKLPDKSVDFFYLDLPYGETSCSWDTRLDLEKLWKELWRLSRHKRVAYVFSCSTKFGYRLIQSWEKGFKMDLVWKKRNKTGGIYSRYRPMKNHEMVYFFYRKAPKYNRDKYHKRIKKLKIDKTKKKMKGYGYDADCSTTHLTSWKGTHFSPTNPGSVIEPDQTCYGIDKKHANKTNPKHKHTFNPPNPASVIEPEAHLDKINKSGKRLHWSNAKKGSNPSNIERHKYEPPNPASVIETDKTTPSDKYKSSVYGVNCKEEFGATYNPPNPASVIEPEQDGVYGDGKWEAEKGNTQGTRNFEPPNPVSIFVSKKVFVGKRFHQTQKPLDLMEFLLKYWTDEGDVVLDPTMGSGSMGVACKKLGRTFIGIEKNQEIFKVAVNRIDKQERVIEL